MLAYEEKGTSNGFMHPIISPAAEWVAAQKGSDGARGSTRMKRVGNAPVRVIAGLFVAAVCAMPQAYTISARPGAINYIEGTVSVNGKRIANDKTRPFLMTNDVLSTNQESRAEVLLTPGVFLRVGQNSEVKMVSPRLTDTQVELSKGEAMVEVAEISKDNNIHVKDGAAAVRLEKVGLYRFTANGDASVQVLEGKAVVEENGRHMDVNKGKETALDADLKSVKFDKKADQQDELLAWSKVRDEYVSAASYSTAKNVGLNNGFGNGFNDGFGGFYGPGWAWNAGFNSWGWLPGDGAFFSPFGYGFYSPGAVGYAPVIYTGVGGYYTGLGTVAVPVNPVHPPSGTNPTLIAGANAAQPGWHPGKWSGTVGNRPVGNNSGHVSSSSIASAHGSVGHAMTASSGGSAGGGGQVGGYAGTGGYASRGAASSSSSGHMSTMSAGGGGHAAAGGGSHK